MRAPATGYAEQAMNQYPIPPMNPVQQVVQRRARPLAITVATTLWLVAGICWPLGVLVRRLAGATGAGVSPGFGSLDFLLSMFGVVVLGIAECWLALLVRGGNWYARLGLAFGAVICETIVLVQLIGALTAGLSAYYGAGAALWWVTMVVWAVIPPCALVFSFLPSVNGYLAARR